MKMTLSLIALAFAGVASACDAVTSASYQTVAASPCQTVQSVSYAPQQVQFVRAAAPQYQAVQVVRVAQPVYQVQRVAVVQQNGYGRVSARGGRVGAAGGFGSNALNGLLSPQGILSVAGAVGGASVGGPIGAGLGSALGNFIGAGLR